MASTTEGESMKDKRFILSIAEKEIEKKLRRSEKNVKKYSDKLREMKHEDTTMTQRRNARIQLDIACEERDRWKRRMDMVKEWKEQV